jgi:hypothetical protein
MGPPRRVPRSTDAAGLPGGLTMSGYCLEGDRASLAPEVGLFQPSAGCRRPALPVTCALTMPARFLSPSLFDEALQRDPHPFSR